MWGNTLERATPALLQMAFISAHIWRLVSPFPILVRKTLISRAKHRERDPQARAEAAKFLTLYSLYQRKDVSYKELTAQARASLRELVSEMESTICGGPAIEMQMIQLQTA